MSVVAAVVFRSWVCNVCHVHRVWPHTSLLDVARAWDGQASLLGDPVDDDCQYRFSGKPISTYMSLTLARLCGEWGLVSMNYELVSGNYKAWGASGRKYKAQIVIFPILAAVNRFSRISRKAESRWRKWKAVEEIRKLLKKIFSNFLEIGKPLKKIPIFPRYSLGSGNFGVSFLTPDLLPRACMDLLDWFQLLIT